MLYSALLARVLDEFFPPRCLACGCPGNYLCNGCLDEFRPIGSKMCLKCGKPTEHTVDDCRSCRRWKQDFDFARAGYVYETTLKRFLVSFKFRGISDAERSLDKLVLPSMLADFDQRFDLVTFVPLHRDKLKKRGFNQSKIIADLVARLLDLSIVDTLRKERQTSDQNSLGLEDRRGNIKNAFSACFRYDGKKILLIDDVFTTGSTVSECALVLKGAGAKQVAVFTLAKRVLD